MSFENPFDDTVWDPTDPEQAIEDPIHGPEACMQLSSIPPMRKQDGTYHVFGGFYAYGTNDFDANGKPFISIGTGMTSAHLRFVQETLDWIEKYHADELPPIEEMGYPRFDFKATPYLVFPD